MDRIGSFLALLIVVLAFAAAAQEQTIAERDALPDCPPGTKWKLIFRDEFEGNKVDYSVWECMSRKRKEGFSRKENISLDGQGNAVIQSRKESDGRYTTGFMRTKDLPRPFGFYIIKCNLPQKAGVGYHSAFWLYTDKAKDVGNGGRDGTEIDIMENFLQGKVQHALHWDGYSKDHKTSDMHGISLSGGQVGWHTFALNWTPKEYVFYVDGKETWRTSDGGVSHVPARIKLTVEFNSFHHKFIGKAKLPDDYIIDYVRTYQLVNIKDGTPLYTPGALKWQPKEQSLPAEVVLTGGNREFITCWSSNIEPMKQIKVEGQNHSEAWDIVAKKGKGVWFNVRAFRPFKAGKKYKLSFLCKTVGDTIEGKVSVTFKKNSKPKKNLFTKEYAISPEWKQYEAVVTPDVDLSPKEARLFFNLGEKNQHLLFGDISVKQIKVDE